MAQPKSSQGSNHPPYFVADAFVDNDQGAVQHGFFGRVGGVSAGIYGSLNCGLGSEDDKDVVQENLRRVGMAYGVEPDHILTLYQIHSNICLSETGPRMPEERPEADAHVTDRPGLVLGILTADCAPVLFSGEKADGTPVIGAAHAGWKGAIGGVLENTVSEMQKLGSVRESIKACVGPCIAQASYEVDKNYVARFLEEDGENERFFKESQNEERAMFDLPGYCAVRLFGAGVGSVTLMDTDTYAREEDFFSYRRKTHRGETDYGRQISTIMIKI